MKYVMTENTTMAAGPETQPSCAMHHASESTPEPITAVIMCALAVISVPTYKKKQSLDQWLHLTVVEWMHGKKIYTGSFFTAIVV